jgi:2-octaprenyl-6-methoxyphenol hydroxylase
MKVSILGNGLTSLALAKMLVNQGIKVDIFSNQKIKKINKNQTLGISKTNINFFNENILNINKFLWNINKIEIFSESLKNDKILNFENNSETLFSIVKNFDLYNYIYLSLNKNKLVKSKKKINYQNLIKKDYKLIFNCDYNHPISKSFFYKKIKKNYNGYAHISVIKHEKLVNNFVASQIFTKKGPLAFLPISSTETSIVFSVKGKKDIDFVNLIKKYNNRYNIFKMTKSLSFELKSSNLRTYHHGNIIAFGDLLHKLHPLAGQGFNMTIRDIKKILELIKFKKEHGLDLDKSICKDFERNTKSKNYLFANSIDFIYEFFNFENKIRNNILSKSVRFLGKNKMINKFFTNLADAGISI